MRAFGLTRAPGQFILSGSYNGAPFHIDRGTGVRDHLEIGHVAERSCGRSETESRNMKQGYSLATHTSVSGYTNKAIG